MDLLAQQPLSALAAHVKGQLDTAVPNETIHLCGLSPLRIIATEPQNVLDLANEKLRTWPYQQVSTSWRRLFEEASLHIAARLIQKQASKHASKANGAKRQKTLPGTYDEAWLAELVKVLDRAVIISGAPGRKGLIDTIFHQLDFIIREDFNCNAKPQHFQITRPRPLQTKHAIQRFESQLEFDAFQLHLDTAASPIIIAGSFEHWPARKLWSDVTYLKWRTLGGNRIVPVEVGTSYNEDDWTQNVMPFSHFCDKFLAYEEPEEIGYLAQHDMFTQVPTLMNDIGIPDYCRTCPPQPKGAAARTSGLSMAKQLDEPLLNAWLGPPRTKTPLHTDTYHNILCQVVGYKYVRLYPPKETAKLYPEGVDASGIDMSNTSQVDVFPFRPRPKREYEELGVDREIVKAKFPEFAEAKYEEAILGPGECLYIPLGYWHYVESLTTSFSVSFWWN